MEEQIMNKLEEIKNLTLLSSKKVLNIDEVCLLTCLSKSYIYKLCASRSIPYWKNKKNRTNYFDKQEIETWMLNERVKTNDEIREAADSYLSKNKKVEY